MTVHRRRSHWGSRSVCIHQRSDGKQHFCDDRCDKLIAQYRSGASLQKVGEYHGVTPERVRQILQSHGVARRKIWISTDLTGRRFGWLTAISYVGGSRWHVRCDCGAEKSVPTISLRKGATDSCGCLGRSGERSSGWKHGHNRTPTYIMWVGMRQRCNNPNHPAYRNYGGRGIRVWPAWNDPERGFQFFLAYLVMSGMGLRPPDLSIDRINNNGHYEPGNIRWATRMEQNTNQRQRKTRESS